MHMLNQMSFCYSDMKVCYVDVCWGSFSRHKASRVARRIFGVPLHKREQQHSWEQQRAEKMMILYELRMMCSVLPQAASRFGEFTSCKVRLHLATSGSWSCCDDEQSAGLLLALKKTSQRHDYKERTAVIKSFLLTWARSTTSLPLLQLRYNVLQCIKHYL